MFGNEGLGFKGFWDVFVEFREGCLSRVWGSSRVWVLWEMLGRLGGLWV